MIDRNERRRRRRRGIIAGLATVALIAVIMALAGCGKASSVASSHPQARASASQIVSGIKTGQAAQQAEGIARACAAKTSGLAIITCIAPHAPKGAHRRAFEHCGKEAFIQDIPGQEVKWVQVDLPGCLVANR